LKLILKSIVYRITARAMLREGSLCMETLRGLHMGAMLKL